MGEEKKVLIMGAAGRDFHDFIMEFRDNSDYKVVGFTMASGQNLGEVSEGEREFPKELAGDLYTDNIPIFKEKNLEEIIEEKKVDQVVFSYSDVSHLDVMHFASRSVSSGADFRVLGGKKVMLESDKPVIAVDAIRTGCGKSQLTRKVANTVEKLGVKPVIVREPMPYGELLEQEVLRFETDEDLEKAGVTLEEREEYEHHINDGHVVYAGIDYQKILEKVEDEAELVIWDGGNNELPFFRPDLHFVLVDPLRPGDELCYHPGESNLRSADVVVVNKENSATSAGISEVVVNVRKVNENAEILHADSKVEVEQGNELEGLKVLVVEDGPTLTHGGTSYGAGTLAAKKYGANVVDPRKSAKGSLRNVFDKYSHLGKVLPAMGYSEEQLKDLEETINSSECDAVILGTPADIRNVLDIEKPVFRVEYSIEEKEGRLESLLDEFVDRCFNSV